jgi:lipopolysaccharide transport system permease protein
MVLYIGLLLWQVFSSTLFGVVSSITSNASLIKKAYFPRLIPALITTVDKAIEIVVGTVCLAVLLVVNDQPPLHALLIVPFLLWALVLGLAIGLWLAWPNVALRDIQQLLPLAVQMLFYISPIVYPVDFLPRALRTLFDLNPVAPIVTAGRWASLGVGTFPTHEVIISAVVTVLMLITGLASFRRLGHVLADVL